MLINIMIHGFRLLIMEYPHGIILVQIYQFQNPHLAKILLKQHDMMIHGMD